MDAKTHSAAVLIAVAFAVTSASGDTYTSDGYLQDGLVAQWDAINNTGVGYHVPDATTWKDIAGGGYDLSLMEGGAWMTKGTSLKVEKGSARGNTAAPAYKTIEVVYKMTATNGRILFNSGSRKHFVLFDGSGTKGYFDGSNRNTPYVAWTYDATAIRSMAATYSDDVIVNAVYKDGVSANAGNNKNDWGTGDGKIMIGDRQVTGSNWPWYGEVYTIRLYSTALTPEQIAANHAVDVARFQGSAPRLVKQPMFAGSTVTVRHTAGQAGDSHALRLVWDTTRTDHGTDYAAWPNNEKIADIADDSTSTTFAAPAAIVTAGQVCCRAVLTKQDGTPVAVSALMDSCTLDPAGNYVLSGPMGFFAPAGETNVYSGLISGTGPAIIYGGGTVAFSHANNTYTGGTLVSNAVFRLDADGCAGLAAITGTVNTSHVYMNCANVPNDMRFLGYYNADEAGQKHSAYPNAGSHPLYALTSPVTVGGKVSFPGYAKITSGSSNESSNPTVTYEKDFVSDTSYLEFATYGKSIFKGRFGSVEYTGDTKALVGLNSSGQGTVEFHSPSNRIGTCTLYHANIYLKATNALPYSLMFNKNGGNANLSKIFLCGNDQTFRGEIWGADSYRPTPGETATGQCWTSVDEPATVRITGCASNTLANVGVNPAPTYVNRLALFGKITLVMDVDPTFTSSGFFQDFSVRKSTTTGDLIISNGDFRVSSTASFPNVPNIYVGEGGSFRCSSTRANAFVGCTNLVVKGTMVFTDAVTDPFGYRTMALTLGSGADRLTLPAGSTLTVTSLKVGDTELPDGKYGTGVGDTPLDQIAQGTVEVMGYHESTSAAWTGGGGADTSVGTAANWGAEETPELSNGALLATFATGGMAADIDRDVKFGGILLSKPDTGFSFTGSGSLSLGDAGIAFNDETPAADGSPRAYTFGPAVTQLSAFDQTFAIPTNVTLSFAGGYMQGQSASNTKTGDGTLVLGGNGGTPGSWRFDGGTTVLSGTNRIDGAIEVTNSTIRFCGSITQAGGAPTTAHSYGWRPGASDIAIRCKPVSGTVSGTRMFFENADIGKRMGIYCPSLNAGQGWFNVAAGSTNVFRSLTEFLDSVGYLNFGEGSETVFEGDLSVSGETDFCGNGTIIFRGGTPFISGSGMRIRDDMLLRIEKAGQYSGGGTLRLEERSRLVTTVDNAFSQNPSRDYWLLLYHAGVTLDIGGTVQGFVLFSVNSSGYRDGNASATITGLPGSELRIRRGYIFQNVTNCVSLTASGTNVNEVLVATNKAFASCGDVKAESGILDFAKNASWLNGSNVTVCGGATLRINNPSGTFGDHAVLRAEGEGWTMALGDGVRQKFAEFYIGGVRQPNGTYGAVGNAAAKYQFANFTGEGLVKVGKLGTMLTIR